MLINTLTAFWLGMLGLIFLPLFMGFESTVFFAPYLVTAYYRCTFQKALWKAVLAGCIVDLFSSSTHFGLTSLSYFFASFLIIKTTRYFFKEKWSTLPLMSALFALLTQVTKTCLNPFFDHPFVFPNLESLGFLSVINALYAACVFTLPFHLYKKFVKVHPSYE